MRYLKITIQKITAMDHGLSGQVFVMLQKQMHLPTSAHSTYSSLAPPTHTDVIKSLKDTVTKTACLID